MSHESAPYIRTPLRKVIEIDYLISVHYFEFSKNHIFEGEAHDFWELVYVDKGEVIAIAEENTFILKKGDMIFHKPNEWHNLLANGITAPNVIIVAFNCPSEAMHYFDDKILHVNDEIRELLTTIIQEGFNAFSSDLGDPYLMQLIPSENAVFGSEQLLLIALEKMMIDMIRLGHSLEVPLKTTSYIREYANNEKLNIVIRFMQEHLADKLTLEDICHSTLLSRSSLQKLFKEQVGVSVMDFFIKLKIDEAKILIREGNHNFSQIAEKLGYNSIHYFSRSFKQVMDMTPSEYAQSVKAKLNQSKL